MIVDGACGFVIVANRTYGVYEVRCVGDWHAVSIYRSEDI